MLFRLFQLFETMHSSVSSSTEQLLHFQSKWKFELQVIAIGIRPEKLRFREAFTAEEFYKFARVRIAGDSG